MSKKNVTVSALFLCSFNWLLGYGLPGINLGFTNILDGGPIRLYPGFYWQQYSISYHASKFLDFEGRPLRGLPSPTYNSWTSITQLIYQHENKVFLDGVPGISIVVPITLYSAIDDNKIGIADAGGGFGNISVGIYNQWSATMHKDRPFFIHRLALDLAMPSCVNKLPKKQSNPGEAFFSFYIAWSATLYAKNNLAFSWRLTYVCSAKDRKINFKAGDALSLNYSVEYELFSHFWAACCGYYLQQLSNSKVDGVTRLDSKERVCGLGPGAAYFFSKDLIFFTYLYGEFAALNRTQGISFVLRLVKHF